MTLSEAIDRVELRPQDFSMEEQLEAWQHLVDTGYAWTLQGWYGRTAADMIDAGIINPPKKENDSE